MLATVTASRSDQTRRDRVGRQAGSRRWALLLAKDGKLPLDDRVRKHIPEPPASAAAVTLRQMAAVRGALRDLGGDEHVLDAMSRQQALNFAPGTNWSNSNSGYNLAGVLVSRLSGISFAAFTKARIFDPLRHDRFVAGRLDES